MLFHNDDEIYSRNHKGQWVGRSLSINNEVYIGMVYVASNLPDKARIIPGSPRYGGGSRMTIQITSTISSCLCHPSVCHSSPWARRYVR